MKLTYNPSEDARELSRLCRLFLESRKGDVLSGMDAQCKFQEIYGISIDYHIWAYELDAMARYNMAKVYDFNGGNQKYLIGYHKD